MSDHADTIRRVLSFPAPTLYDRGQALEAAEALLAERQQAQEECLQQARLKQQAIDERDALQRNREAVSEEFDVLAADRDELRARCEQAIDALRVYADPRYWAISRDDLNHRVVSWIGPGAEKAGMPDALETARAALVSLGEKPTP